MGWRGKGAAPGACVRTYGYARLGPFGDASAAVFPRAHRALSTVPDGSWCARADGAAGHRA
ncbi:MAG: hypothetical protein V7646_5524 [Pseudonocardia sp.]